MDIKEQSEDYKYKDIYPSDCYIAIVYFETEHCTQLWLDLQEV